MAIKQTQIETLEMREAFEHYYQLDTKRSYKLVSEKYGRSITTIKRWALSFQWAKRVEQRDIEVKKEVSKRSTEAVVNSKALYRETIATLTETFIREVHAGKVKIRSVLDFEKIVRLDMELMGADLNQDKIDNMTSLVGALAGSGISSVPDPKDES